MKHCLLLSAVLFLLSACSDNQLVGTWVQPIPGQENAVQGFTLNKDGSASSVNMHTLIYKSWQQEGNILKLSGESLGNGQIITINEEFLIKQLDKKSLILQRGTTDFNYRRQQK